MWVLFSVICVTIIMIISSIEISKHRVRFYEAQERIVPFVKNMMVQLVISIFLIVASGYLFIKIDSADQIRNTTNNTPEFFRAILDQIFYLAALGFLVYGYKKYKNKILDDE